MSFWCQCWRNKNSFWRVALRLLQYLASMLSLSVRLWCFIVLQLRAIVDSPGAVQLSGYAPAAKLCSFVHCFHVSNDSMFLWLVGRVLMLACVCEWFMFMGLRRAVFGLLRMSTSAWLNRAVRVSMSCVQWSRIEVYRSVGCNRLYYSWAWQVPGLETNIRQRLDWMKNVLLCTWLITLICLTITSSGI